MEPKYFKMKDMFSVHDTRLHGASGKSYAFSKNNSTKVYDTVDIEFFSADDRFVEGPPIRKDAGQQATEVVKKPVVKKEPAKKEPAAEGALKKPKPAKKEPIKKKRVRKRKKR